MCPSYGPLGAPLSYPPGYPSRTTLGAHLQAYAAQYHKEVTELLRRLPRIVLLLLKTNDCLRSVDKALVCPGRRLLLSVYVYAAAHCALPVSAALTVQRCLCQRCTVCVRTVLFVSWHTWDSVPLAKCGPERFLSWLLWCTFMCCVVYPGRAHNNVPDHWQNLH